MKLEVGRFLASKYFAVRELNITEIAPSGQYFKANGMWETWKQWHLIERLPDQPSEHREPK